MRKDSVTEGDKVSAEIKFGFSVNGFGLGDLVAVMNDVSASEVSSLIQEYDELYDIADELRNDRRSSLEDAARQELAIRRFLEAGGFTGFTTTFEDLHGLNQLPGLACQRLMADGYGFGAEGDWKTAALLRFMKVVANGEGTSFMEDYTYHLDPERPLVLGAHMLEICPSIAASKPRMEIHPLGIGGKADPVRLVFDAPPGQAINASLIDLGHRFRLIVSEVEAVDVPAMPKLPVARAVWKVKPDFESGIAGWIRAGGAHHTVYSYGVTAADMRDFAEIAGIECVVIGEGTRYDDLVNELRWNEVAYRA
jgi:L-arabinose isomerase